MSQGVTLREAEEKRERPPGFFPQLYESVCKKLSAEDYETLQKLKDDPAEFIKYVNPGENLNWIIRTVMLN